MEADRPAEPSSRRAQRWTFVAIGLLAVPIFVAMLYGVFGRGGDDRPPVRSGAPSVLEDDDRKGSAVGPAIAITALGGIVAVCIAVPLVRAHRRRSTAVGSSAESA
jgi:ABC-type Fe3+ transport system permease subunit